MIVLNCGPALTTRQRYLLKPRDGEVRRIYNLTGYGYRLGMFPDDIMPILSLIPVSPAQWFSNTIYLRTFGDIGDFGQQIAYFLYLLPHLYAIAAPLLTTSISDDLRIIVIGGSRGKLNSGVFLRNPGGYRAH